MATIPEHLVDYVASPEEPSLDAMRYMLMQRNALPATPPVDLSLHSQIPGMQPAPQPQPQRPLDRVTEQFKRLGANANPLLMAKSLQDMVTTAVVNPLLVPASIAGEALTRRPITGSLLAKQPQTPLGQEFAESLFKGLETAKVPHMWPLTPRPAGMRPALTPNDVRVMGAQATHALREASQIPSDIANVRNFGAQRLSPLTGEPSVGSRIGSAIEGTSQVARDVGQDLYDYTVRRREMGLGLVPGVPAALMPDLNMYAVRPKGTALTYPTVPETKLAKDVPIGSGMQEIVSETGADKAQLSPNDAKAYLLQFSLDDPQRRAFEIRQTELPATTLQSGWDPTLPQRRESAYDAFFDNKVMAMYPTAPNIDAAREAFTAQFSKSGDESRALMRIYDEFRESPEGQAVQMGRLPSSTELQERHQAASNWLNSTLLNYAKKHLGAEGDPLVQQATEGVTALPAERVLRLAEQPSVQATAVKMREVGGMPAAGLVKPFIDAKQKEVDAANAELSQIERSRAQYRDIAMQQGLADPAMLPEYAATTNQRTAAVARRDKLLEELENLRLGAAYETVSDAAVNPRNFANAKLGIQFPEQQFFPALERMKPDERLYFAHQGQALINTGLRDVATRLYEDVLSGAMPISKLKDLTVPKYVRQNAELRIQAEKAQKEQERKFIADINEGMRQDAAKYIPAENRFGNIGALELSTSTGFTPEQIRRLISYDTLVLDHCVAEGPSGGRMKTNPWQGNRERTYQPLTNPLTGELALNAGTEYTGYMRNASKPDANEANMLTSIRDVNGVPVLTFEFKRRNDGKYNIGFASGYRNSEVDAQYHEGIRDYLNSRADMIGGSGTELSKNVNILDTKSPDFLRDAARIVNQRADDLRMLPEMQNLPRFVLPQDIKNIVAGSVEPEPRLQGTARLLHDVSLAMDNAIRDAEYTPGLEARVRPMFDTILSETGMRRDTFTPENLNSLVARLEERRDYFMRSRRQTDNIIGDAYDNALTAVEGIRDQFIRGQYNEQPVAQQPAQQHAPQQPVAQQQSLNAAATLMPNTRLAVDNAFERAERALAGDDEATRRFVALQDDVYSTYLQHDATIADLRMARVRIENAIDFYESVGTMDTDVSNALRNELLPAINAILEPPAVPIGAPVRARIGERQPAAQQPAAQQHVTINDVRRFLDNVRQNVGDDEGSAVTDILRAARQSFPGAPAYSELLREQPTAFAERISELAEQQNSAIVEQLIFELADRIAPRVPAVAEPAAQRPALGLFEEIAIARNLLEDARLDNQTFNVPALHAMLSMLENGRVNDPRFTDLGPQSAAAQLEVARSLRQQMQDAGMPLPEAAQPDAAQQLVNQQLEQDRQQNDLARVQAIRQLDRNALVQQVEPNRWPLLNERVDQATADVFPEDGAMLANMIRNGQIHNITNGLTAVERELVARDAQQLVEIRARRQGAAAQQPPAVDEIRQANRDELINLIDPNRWPLLDARVEQAVARWAPNQQARIDENIRNGLMPDLTDDLIAIERELVAREAQRVVEGNARGQGAAAEQPQQEPEQPNIAPIRRIPANIRRLPDTELLRSLSQEQFTTSSDLFLQLINANDIDELHTILDLVRNHRMGGWDTFNDAQREHVARLLERHVADEARPRNFKDGGSVKYPNIIKSQNEAITRAQEMYPRAWERDDEADAARHMLAAGYASKSLSPGIAKALGWLHEAKEAPFRTIGHALGISKPRYDYEMDMHNNALGVELAQRAKDRAEFERLVQDSIRQGTTSTQPGRVRLMTPKQAEEGISALKYANGGTVQRNPSVDEMRYELMMRSK